MVFSPAYAVLTTLVLHSSSHVIQEAVTELSCNDSEEIGLFAEMMICDVSISAVAGSFR